MFRWIVVACTSSFRNEMIISYMLYCDLRVIRCSTLMRDAMMIKKVLWRMPLEAYNFEISVTNVLKDYHYAKIE